MIMVSELTLNNYTRLSNPSWMNSENYARLLNEKRIADRNDRIRLVLNKVRRKG